MSGLFEWDKDKARLNLQKHRIGFAKAVSVFGNPLARIFADQDHSAGEQLLLVCFTELVEGGIRIISARRATKREQQDYEEHIAG
jgi:uncharacterized DUF497 family protein